MHMDHGHAAWPLFFLIPIFWVLIIGLVVTLIIRLNRRRWSQAGGPPWADARFGATKSAEATLSERFAQGDIDEDEYRARLEVLRASQLDRGKG